MGLTGASFSAVFGANQSMLEALMLKRHIMGPGWLTVTRPRRVAPESQVGGGWGLGWCAGGRLGSLPEACDWAWAACSTLLLLLLLLLLPPRL